MLSFSGEQSVGMDERQPPSPRLAPVQLEDCIEELLKFTLTSAVDGTLGVDIGLSKHYCSNLLKEDPDSPCPDTSVLSEGVPPYPLYKRLAASLWQCISSRAFCRTHNKMASIDEDNSWKQKEDEWNKLILQHGSELLNILKIMDFEVHVQEPFFTQLKDGQKTVEGRCALGDYTRIGSRSLILFNKCLVLQVQDVHWYATFHEMLEAESLVKVLPGVGTIEEGVQVYRKFYSEDKERSNGVLAFYMKCHLTICLEDDLCIWYPDRANSESKLDGNGFGYEGVQRLLGFVHTVGTVPEALPPPRSTLLSSFLLPHNPDIKGSTLTDGTRALAKHVNRSGGRYWGTFRGSDSDKNNLAVDAIGNLLAHSCWLNMHIVSPHGVVFEIRVSDGYGARWSEDGTQFIGFLEPYSADGHLKGWKH
ncbi:hypothetical protein RJ639_035195 [Escallonia herrerae]|uniref:ASCH domain-containing protein n=1 Tax=Escallonia herrerae TaxID=1293975 RepID=A0AA88WWC0_9ASTE|nr:hypothetical protein RJ639_035195 [Escallonia herrerae]